MKLTLLQMVQEILSDMDSDDIDSYLDTTESEQVSRVIHATYFSMISTRQWPHLLGGLAVTSLADVTKPTHLIMPDNSKELVSIHYNKVKLGDTRKRYGELRYIDSDDFLRRSYLEDSTSASVVTVADPSGIEILVRNDRAPEVYTSFNDKHLICDSYDAALATTLEDAKVQAMGYRIPVWDYDTGSSDGFIPDLPDDAFRSLVEEAKSRCMFRFKQMPDSKAEQDSRDQSSWLSRNSKKVSRGIKYPNYGRKR